jgi:hypothetical protein
LVANRRHYAAQEKSQEPEAEGDCGYGCAKYADARQGGSLEADAARQGRTWAGGGQVMKKHNRDAYAFADDYEVEDGQSVRVPVMVCDSRRPGYVNWKQIHERRLATEARLLADAKRKPRDDDPDNNNGDDPDEIASLEDKSLMDIRRPSIEARDAYVASLSSAWRNATPRQLTNSKQTDAAEPDNSSSAEVMRRHLHGDDPKDVQAKRDAAYAEYSASISNAWKSVPAQNTLRAASGIERLREQTAGK